jgi:hypothetical protein
MHRLLKTLALAVAISSLLTGCQQSTGPTPEQTRAQLNKLLPKTVKDREGWAADIQYAFTTLKIDPSNENLCSVLAITEQESTFTASPAVPGLGKIAIKEIEERAARYKVPVFVVRGALQIKSPNGSTWEQRISNVTTEKELSELFEEMTTSMPMGSGKLLARANPVRTGGPMQVSIAYAEAHAREKQYPYTVESSIRHEVFTRRGGMYFGIAHLLDYPASYKNPMFRFADFNAGHYASRNAAFQNAVSTATGIALDLDGDLIRYKKNGKDDKQISATEVAVRSMAQGLNMTHDEIHRDLKLSRTHQFERSELYQRVFAIADQRNGKPLPHATLPRIRLESPKITRKLTTEWFATRVNKRYKTCMAKAAK